MIEPFPITLAEDLGFFQTEGVKVDIQQTSKLAHAVLTGSCDISYEGFSATLRAAAAGRQLTEFFLMANKATILFVVSAEKARTIRSVTDLKGAKVGIAGFGPAFDSLLQHLLRQHGLSPFRPRRSVLRTSPAICHPPVLAVSILITSLPMASGQPGWASKPRCFSFSLDLDDMKSVPITSQAWGHHTDGYRPKPLSVLNPTPVGLGKDVQQEESR